MTINAITPSSVQYTEAEFICREIDPLHVEVETNQGTFRFSAINEGRLKPVRLHGRLSESNGRLHLQVFSFTYLDLDGVEVEGRYLGEAEDLYNLNGSPALRPALATILAEPVVANAYDGAGVRSEIRASAGTTIWDLLSCKGPGGEGWRLRWREGGSLREGWCKERPAISRG